MTQRILVVDDNVQVHELIRWVLRAPRFEIHAFGDPQQAIVRARDIKPDLIICDMMMPTMDGQLFLRLVKQVPELARVPFLFLTAVRLGSEVQAALNAGADAYLVKPFPLAKLVETVEAVLEESERRAAAALRSSDATTADANWPATTHEPLLEALAAPTVQPQGAGTEGTRTASTDAPAVPRAEMATQGATGLSATSLAPPDRPGDATEAPAGSLEAPPEGQAPVFEGRFSTLDLEIGRVQVVTRAKSRPNLVITTVLSLESAEKDLKKIETFWCHPLQGRADLERVRRQIDLQHDRAVKEARREPLFSPRREEVWRRDSPKPESA